MSCCCAYGCTSRPSKKIRGVTFHRFPLNKRRRAAWILAVRRKNWLPTTYTRICSLHFEEKYFDRSMKNVILRENAVPSIFPGFPSNYQNEVKSKKQQTASRKIHNDTLQSEVNESSTSQLNNAPLLENMHNISDSPSKLSTKFSKDSLQRHVCLNKLKQKNFESNEDTYMCSENFTADSFNEEIFEGDDSLRETAVSTKDNFPSHLQTVDNCIKSEKTEEMTIIVQSVVSLQNSTAISNSLDLVEKCSTNLSDESLGTLNSCNELAEFPNENSVNKFSKLKENSQPIEESKKLIQRTFSAEKANSREGQKEMSDVETSGASSQILTVSNNELRTSERFRYIGDFKDGVRYSSFIEARRWSIVKDVIKKQKTKIKTLHQKKRRLEKKISILSMLLDLKDIDFIDQSIDEMSEEMEEEIEDSSEGIVVATIMK